VKLYSWYCEPFATQQMRPDRLARRAKMPVFLRGILKSPESHQKAGDLSDLAGLREHIGIFVNRSG
jgi:hypothetical protein